MAERKAAVPKHRVESEEDRKAVSDRSSKTLRVNQYKIAALEKIAFDLKQKGSKVRLPDLLDEALDMVLAEYGVTVD